LHSGNLNHGVSEVTLYEAVKNGNVDETRRLIDQGMDINQKDKDRNTLLCISVMEAGGAIEGWSAREKVYMEIAELLISNGAGVNNMSKSCATLLDNAKVFHHKEMVELPIKHGGKLNKLSGDSGSP